ncbi:Calcium-dependent lipid-binding (CaLB domain) family protein [Striga hermonthica]|uniref:Calcium-dependent lipid-binding (CaLB domain) family protein n=1 Tax=Striga hermonthica TaxID=68872 RepID=A0A9N7MNF8_STRHE|nr:Calcium-dependent lipid-binding (CaLB domain) family protein [Striga hermonthica]
MASGSAPGPRQKLYDLEVTVISAKHLKNVNWRKGDLKPYAVLWIDPDRRQVTKADDSGSTRPVWNERFVLPLSVPPSDSSLTLEILHSRPSFTSEFLVGTLRVELRDLLVESDGSPVRLRSFELRRPSGRPQGKIRLKLCLIERPAENYQTAPPSGYYYSSALPSPYRAYSTSYSSVPPPTSYSPPLTQPYYSYSDQSSRYYSSYYSHPPPPPRPFFERQSSLGPDPSAPVEYTPYDYHKPGASKPGIGVGTGLAVGGVSGALGGLVLEEGVKYEEEKNELASTTARDDRYAEYRM